MNKIRKQRENDREEREFKRAKRRTRISTKPFGLAARLSADRVALHFLQSFDQIVIVDVRAHPKPHDLVRCYTFA